MLIQLFMILHKSRNKINIMTWCLSFDYCLELNQPALVLSVHCKAACPAFPHRCSLFTHCTAVPTPSNCCNSAGPLLSTNLIHNRPMCCFPMGVLSECYVSGHEKYCFIKNFIGILARKSLNTIDLNLNIESLLNAF